MNSNTLPPPPWLLQRRRQMMAKNDNYGWVNARLGDNINALEPDETGQILCSPIFDVSYLPTNLNNIRVRTSLTRDDLRIILYHNAGFSAKATRWSGQMTTIRHYPNYNLLRIEVLASDIDYCYIYDLTNQAFIWKGRKVTEPI